MAIGWVSDAKREAAALNGLPPRLSVREGTMSTTAPTTRYLQRPDGRVAYDLEGDGPLVVCVPGMGDLRSNFRYLRPALVEAGYRVACMDLRGHGDSDTRFERYDDIAAGNDLLALVRELGSPAVLIGNSMGAGGAVWAAAEQPDAVAGLVLIGPFVRKVPVSRVALLTLRLALRRPWGPGAWTAYYAKLYPGRKPADLDQHRAAIRQWLARPGAWDAFVQTTHTDHTPIEPRLGDVRTPALVVMGEADPDFPDPAAEARLMAERLHGRVLLVPGAGHYPHAEYPEVVSPEVLRFLTEVAPAG
jgi:pimeloyl-ACP methyl ester carboxylesterase